MKKEELKAITDSSRVPLRVNTYGRLLCICPECRKEYDTQICSRCQLPVPPDSDSLKDICGTIPEFLEIEMKEYLGPFRECGYYWIFIHDGELLRAWRNKNPAYQDWEPVDSDNSPKFESGSYAVKSFYEDLIEIISANDRVEFFDCETSSWHQR